MAEEKKATSAKSDVKTNAILAWLFAPITSLIWKDDKDEFLSYHAKQSLSWGIVAVIGHVALFVLGTVLSVVFVGIFCLVILWPIWGVLDLVVRIVGLVKANNGEKWEVPVVGGLIK